MYESCQKVLVRRVPMNSGGGGGGVVGDGVGGFSRTASG